MEWKDGSDCVPLPYKNVLIWVEWDDSPIIGWYSNGHWYEHTEYCIVRGDAYLDREISVCGRIFWKEIEPYPFPEIKY